MSSRSRKNRRNAGDSIKKADSEKTQKEDILSQEEEVIGRRRSLRHSPNSPTVSPPRKVRRLRPSVLATKIRKSGPSKEVIKSPPVTRRSKRVSGALTNSDVGSSSTNGKKSVSPHIIGENTNGNFGKSKSRRSNKVPSPTIEESPHVTTNSELPLTNGPIKDTPPNKRGSKKRYLSSPKSSENEDKPVTPRKSRRTKRRSKKAKLTENGNSDDSEDTSAITCSNGHLTDQIDPTSSKRILSKRKLSSPEPALESNKLKVPRKEEEIITDVPVVVTDVNSSKNCEKVSKNIEPHKTVILTEKEISVESLLDSIVQNHDQKIEILSLIPEEMKDLGQTELIQFLVKTLLSSDVALKTMTSPRFNKCLRNLLSIFCASTSTVDQKHELCESALQWASMKKSVNLKHEIESSLMNLYYETKFYRRAEQTANDLYAATKKLQDKEKNVQACLCLSKTYHAMGNVSKARANITTAKTEALKIYTPPDLQAELDLQSGIMQIAEEKDMETAFSYFKEAATGSTDPKKRSRALKYMLLSKLIINRPEDGEKAVTSAHLNDIDEGVEAMLHITKAAITCSLTSFTNAVAKYEKELKEDMVVKHEIDNLYSKMLEKNLITIIQPYSRMQISCIAEKIGLPRDEIEKRLSQLILDGQLKAQLDHRDDCLYVYSSELQDAIYPSALKVISQFDRSLSLLNRKTKQLL